MQRGRGGLENPSYNRGVARAAPGGQGKANGEFIPGRPPVVTGKGFIYPGFPEVPEHHTICPRRGVTSYNVCLLRAWGGSSG